MQTEQNRHTVVKWHARYVANQWCLGTSAFQTADPATRFGVDTPLLPSVASHFSSSRSLSATKGPPTSASRCGERCQFRWWGQGQSPGRNSILVYFEVRKCLVFGYFYGNENVHLKFLNQKWSSLYRLLWVAYSGGYLYLWEQDMRFVRVFHSYMYVPEDDRTRERRPACSPEASQTDLTCETANEITTRH